MATTNLIAAAQHDFEVYRGDTAPIPITFPDSISLSGTTVRLMIKVRATDEVAIADWSNGNGLTIAGQVLTINSWGAIPTGHYYYDMQFTFANGQVATYLAGMVKVKQDITRS